MVSVRQLLEVAEDMERGVFDFTIDGKCSNCGSCCSNFLPMSSKEVKEIHRYIEKKRVSEQRAILPVITHVVDLRCPFRSDAEKKCLIYEKRPAICRDFQCDKPRKHIQANKKMYHGKYSIVDMREEFFRK